jgi:hypothetical protein
MNGGAAKKLKRYANKKIKYDIGNVLNDLCKAGLLRRINFALRIIFKYKVMKIKQ